MCSKMSKACVRKGVELKQKYAWPTKEERIFVSDEVLITGLKSWTCVSIEYSSTIEMPPAAPQHFQFEHLLRAPPAHPFFRSKIKQCRHSIHVMCPWGAAMPVLPGAHSPCFICLAQQQEVWAPNTGQVLGIQLRLSGWLYFSDVVCLEMERLLLSLPFSEAFFKMKSTA